jgi:hypothetical protein
MLRGGAEIVRENDFEVPLVPGKCSETVKLNVPTAVGVPVMAPLAESRESPGGKFPDSPQMAPVQLVHVNVVEYATL